VAPEEDAQAQEAQASEARAPQAQVSGFPLPAFFLDSLTIVWAAPQRQDLCARSSRSQPTGWDRERRASSCRSDFRIELIVVFRAKVLRSPAASTLIGLIFLLFFLDWSFGTV